MRDVLCIDLEGADTTTLRGGQELRARSNYFSQGHDTGLTDIANFGLVVAREAYSGVDVVCKGNQSLLQFDFVLKPGADASQIELGYEGVAAKAIGLEGQLVLAHASGEVVTQRAPILYQDVDGQRVNRTGRYVLNLNATVGFEVDSYDPARALTIDPTLDYSTYLGGSGEDGASDTARDLQGNVYVVGYSDSADFPTQTPYQDETGSDLYISRFSPDGKTFAYHAGRMFRIVSTTRILKYPS